MLAETLVTAWNQIQHFESSDLTLEPWLPLLARNHAWQYRHQMSVPEEKLELAWFESLSFDEIAHRLKRPMSEVIATADAAAAGLRGFAA